MRERGVRTRPQLDDVGHARRRGLSALDDDEPTDATRCLPALHERSSPGRWSSCSEAAYGDERRLHSRMESGARWGRAVPTGYAVRLSLFDQLVPPGAPGPRIRWS
jgi:hypothetical protein